MLFNSADFLIFFPVVTALYFALPFRFRWALLLAASCFFYMAFVPWYILILAFTIVIDYFAGILIDKAAGARRKLILGLSIASNVGILSVFKYFDFFNANIASLAQWLHWNYSIGALELLLPIGLSFHTFQALSYTMEVYRGHQKPERHFGIYALYVMFYPQLVAGPIERPQNLLPQFHREHRFDYQRVVDGLKLMLLGFFKKVVIADNLAPDVNRVYASPEHYAGLPLIIATVFFAYQIYCDFSGYSDIARGAARVMGFELMVNFRQPYLAASITDFWRRWHISLSTWFRDYLYIPLGGNRGTRMQCFRNVLIVFLVSGLWHGANWLFVIWGGLHGIYFLVSSWTRALRERAAAVSGLARMPALRRGFGVVGTFALVTFAWIFFRAKTFADAQYIVAHLFTGSGALLTNPTSLELWRRSFGGLGLGLVKVAVASAFLLEVLTYFHARFDFHGRWAALPIGFRWAGYYAAVVWILVFGNFGAAQFIYFQF